MKISKPAYFTTSAPTFLKTTKRELIDPLLIDQLRRCLYNRYLI
jgi:hypothetical protein